MLSILAAIVVLGLLIFVHELGHFMAAKRLVSSRAEVDATRLGDAAVPLTSLAA